jgi:uncharacterized damage-inducible protein DinB
MDSLLVSLTDYNVWANKRIIELLNAHPSGLLNAYVNSSYPTIRKTIYHIWDAQVIWLQRMQGLSLTVWPSEEYGDDFTGYDIYFIRQSEDFRNYVSSKPESFFNTICYYRTMNGKEYKSYNSEIIVHCMNHSTYHRGQIITMLRNLDVTEIPSTDFIVYLREQQAG